MGAASFAYPATLPHWCNFAIYSVNTVLEVFCVLQVLRVILAYLRVDFETFFCNILNLELVHNHFWLGLRYNRLMTRTRERNKFQQKIREGFKKKTPIKRSG